MIDNMVRTLAHGTTQEALFRLKLGTQKTLRRSKLQCSCDACSELIDRFEREKRIR